MSNKTNFKQQNQRPLKTAATVATVVRQLAKITVAASKYAACSRKCDSCDSLFSATVHFLTIKCNRINDLENVRQCDSCPYI